jgi:hypothetical protein
MSKTAPRINGRKCRPYVQDRKAFTNSNGQLYAVRHTPLLYVVYSYGEHWPLFVHDGFDWYENEDRYSPTTTGHRSYAHPFAPTIKVGRTWLRNFITNHKGHYRALDDVQSTLGLAA